MGIDGIYKPGIQKLPASGSGNRPEKSNGFKEILQRKISQTEALEMQSSSNARPGFLARSEKVLDLLEMFARQLTDAQKTLRDIEPLVESIEKETVWLEQDIVAGEAVEKEVSQMVREVAVTATVATSKFHRGDYM